MRDVDPEAVHPTVQPETQHVVELVVYLLVGPVEVGLARVEQVQVPLLGGAIGAGEAGPGRTAEDRLPVVGRLLAVGALAVPEDVARTRRVARFGGHGLTEPRVLGGGVVGDHVDDHPDALFVGVLEQGVEVVEGAETRVHVAVVGDVVTAIGQGRDVERSQPDRVDAQFDEMGQTFADARQVALPVTVGIGEAAHVDLVDGGLTPPTRLMLHQRGPSRLLLQVLAQDYRQLSIM